MSCEDPFLAGPVNRQASSGLERKILGQLGVRLRGRLVLGLDGPPELFAVHGDRLGRIDADADTRAGDLDHLDDDIVAEHDLLARPSRDDEHGDGSSLEPWGTGAMDGPGRSPTRPRPRRSPRTAERAPERREPG